MILRKQKNTTLHPQLKLQRGLSLIELMIAITLGLVVIAGVGTAYLGGKQSYRVNENLSRMQENARYAFDILSKEIRMAGYYGCASSDVTVVNTLNNASNYAWDFTQAIYGFESIDATTWSPSLPSSGSPQYGPASPLGGSDIVVVRSIMGNGTRVLQHPGGTPPGSADLKVTVDSGIVEGDILMVADCQGAAIFQATDVNTSGGFDNTVHNTGSLAGMIPGNATQNFGREFVGAELIKLATRTYYIRNNASGVPALYRVVGAGASEEMVEGIEGMQVLYGVDETGDFAANSYHDASWVDSNARWPNVVSAQIQLLVRSPDNNLVNAAQTYKFNGANVTAADRRLRQVFTSTIALRNRTF